MDRGGGWNSFVEEDTFLMFYVAVTYTGKMMHLSVIGFGTFC